jgi:L-amino acid N-acyltransferase YncA
VVDPGWQTRRMLIRPATASDLPAVAGIYEHEVRTGIATFDLEPRPIAVWESRLASTEPGDHLLVAAADGEVHGYAQSSAYRPKAGYRHTRETSIYLAAGAQGQGLGRRMYGDLLDRLVADGVHLAVAGIALPNPASLALHRAFGFEDVGVMREVGRKLDRWIDVLWLQKPLGQS